MRKGIALKKATLLVAIFATSMPVAYASAPEKHGTASWYGEDHRGRLMANGKPFNPDHLTAASWFYPLGTKVRVTTRSKKSKTPHTVVVTITDRGPSKQLVRGGRIIDLGHAAFKKLAPPGDGLVAVRVEKVK